IGAQHSETAQGMQRALQPETPAPSESYDAARPRRAHARVVETVVVERQLVVGIDDSVRRLVRACDVDPVPAVETIPRLARLAAVVEGDHDIDRHAHLAAPLYHHLGPVADPPPRPRGGPILR